MSGSDNVTPLPGALAPVEPEPKLIALLGNSDGPARLFVEFFFSEASFEEGVARALFGSGWRDLKHAQEVVAAAAALRDDGSVDFEDGWLARVVGITAIEEALVSRFADARADERFADERRVLAERHLAAIAAEVARLRRRLGLLPLGYGGGDRSSCIENLEFLMRAAKAVDEAYEACHETGWFAVEQQLDVLHVALKRAAEGEKG